MISKLCSLLFTIGRDLVITSAIFTIFMIENVTFEGLSLSLCSLRLLLKCRITFDS